MAHGTRAGWAQTDITPPLGLPLGGRGARSSAADELLDPLSAQAMMLQDHHGGRLLLVSLDLIAMTPGLSCVTRSCLAAATGVPPDRVLLNFSHTHSGPMTQYETRAWACYDKPKALDDYERQLVHRLVSLAMQANAQLAPVTAAWHEGVSDIGINRRLRTAQGMTMAPNPEGFYNRDLWVIDLRREDGARAMVFCHGCHPVIVYGYQFTGISGEWPSVARRRVAQAIGDGAHVQFLQGLAGNIRPRTLADRPNQKFRKSEPADLVYVGETIAGDVLAALGEPGEPLALELAAASTTVLLERDEPPPRAVLQAALESASEAHQNAGAYWLRRYDQGPPPAPFLPLTIGLARLSPEHHLAYLGAEAVAEWLPLLRRVIPSRRLIACGYTQEVVAYVATDALLPEGGYEVTDAHRSGNSSPAPLKHGIDQTVQCGFAELVNQLIPRV